MNVGLLAMVLYAFVAGLLGVRRGLRHFAIPLLFAATSAASLMAFKIAIPAPHHTDFRHIYFAMVPGATLFGAAVEHMRGRAWILGAAGTLLYVPFLVLSIVYFLPKYEYVMKYTHSTTELPLAAVQRTCPDGTPWDRDGNVLIEGNETIALTVDPPAALVKEVDTSVDGNDTYEIRLFSKTSPARTLIVRPRKVIKVGLARELLKLDPPLPDVTRVTVRPLSGDRTYSMCHLLLN